MRLKRTIILTFSLVILVLIFFININFLFHSIFARYGIPKIKNGSFHNSLNGTRPQNEQSVRKFLTNLWFNKLLYRSVHIKSTFYIVVVACGQRLKETLTMIKSALLYNQTKELLKFIIFADDDLMSEFKEKLIDWQILMPHVFEFELRRLNFPQNNEKEWRSLFKPCAAQRLFLPSILKDIDSILYVDTDILFLSPVTDIWNHFSRFNASQVAGLSPEHENPNIGWYNRFARHPFYGKLGLNSGVMLMNLTQMRAFNWEARVLPIYREYKLRITWGDQDIINILFYYHSEKLYLFSCEYNYRPDHCMYMNVCEIPNGIKIVHGNRGYFHSNKEPLFGAVYDAIESYQLNSNAYSSFLMPLKEALDDPAIQDSNCGKVSKEFVSVADALFLSDYKYEES